MKKYACTLSFQANNLVFHSVLEEFKRSSTAEKLLNGGPGLPHIIISNVEHDSVQLVAENLQKTGQAGENNNVLELLKAGLVMVCRFPCLVLVCFLFYFGVSVLFLPMSGQVSLLCDYCSLP